jgi:tetratricopeptide (TPR) repeat protein
MKRRSLKQLKCAVETASDKREKALAIYELGLFHDNNSREAAAIPNYQKAIQLGLDKNHEVMARTWLASSFLKTGQPELALKECHRAFKLAKNARLREFVMSLEKKLCSTKRDGTK